MSTPPDHNESANVFQKSMEEAMAHLDKVNEEVLKAKEKAIDQENAAKEELKRIQNDAERLSAEFIEKHRKEYDARVRRDTFMEIIEKLLNAGIASGKVKEWLEVSDEMIAHAHMYLKFGMLGNKPAKVSYESQGRGGYVHFNWDGHLLKFYYEFGGGNTLATIDVPELADWEKETRLPETDRQMVLDFIAQRVIEDQASGHKYEFKDGYIRIYKD